MKWKSWCYCWRHNRSIMFYSVSMHEPHRVNPLKWPEAGLESSVFGLHPLVNVHNCNNKYASWGFVWYQVAWVTNSNEFQFHSCYFFLYFVFFYKIFDIFIDEMESEQFLFVMRSFFMQNKSHTLIQQYLVLQAIQPETLTNHFCTLWTGWQEVIYKPYNIAAD